MDSRDILIIGAVAVGAFLLWRNRNAVELPNPGPGAMTASAAATTTPPVAPPTTMNLHNAVLGRTANISALGNFIPQFAGTTALAVVTDAIAPAPPTPPPVTTSPTFLGGARVYPVGANSMGPQPPTTSIVNPATRFLTRY